MLLAGYAAEDEDSPKVNAAFEKDRPALGDRLALLVALARASHNRTAKTWSLDVHAWLLDDQGKPNTVLQTVQELLRARNTDSHPSHATEAQRDDAVRSLDLVDKLRRVLLGLERLFSFRIVQVVQSEQALAGGGMEGTIQHLQGDKLTFEPERHTWVDVPLRQDRVFLRHPTDGRLLDATGWLVIVGGPIEPKLCAFAGFRDAKPVLHGLQGVESPALAEIFKDTQGRPLDFGTWFAKRRERVRVWPFAGDTAARHALAAEILVGGRFALKRFIGEGGMAEVWEASDRQGGAPVAIKVLRSELAQSERMRLRFEGEADLLRRVRHPRVLTCIAVESIRGRPAMVLPLLRGTLQERIGSAPKEAIPRWIAQALEGIQALHKEQLVHRDIKPSNLFLDSSERVIVGDLGVASDPKRLRLTLVRETVGTELYWAPEQALRAEVGPEADIYALSRVADALWFGVEPAPRRASGEGIPGEFGEIVRKMGAEMPGARPSAAEALERVRAVVSVEERPAVSPSETSLVGRVLGAVLSTVATLSFAALAVLGLVVVVWWVRPRASELAMSWSILPEPPATAQAAVEVPAAPPPQRGPPANPLGITLVRVPAGSFVPGAPDAAAGRQEVSISRDLLVSAHEITQGQWTAAGGAPVWKQRFDRFPDSGPRGFREGGACAEVGVGDELPAVCMSWREAIDLCNRLSSLEGLRPAYEITSGEVRWIRHANGYRLLTVAEWEYAARAGKGGAWGDPSVDPSTCRAANLLDLSGVRHAGEALRPQALRCEDGHPGLAPVGSFAPNAWGLHDTVGNVWEWNFDAEDKAGTAAVDPLGALDASRRSRSGGSWRSKPGQASVWQHPRQHVEHYDRATGLRVARWAP
jgi:serine/threonine-protein kinase